MDKSQQLKAEIVCYLARNPDAADTVDGIRWWLREVRPTDEALRRVLEELERDGAVLRRHLPDGKELWSAAG